MEGIADMANRNSKPMASANSNAMPRYGTVRNETERHASKTKDSHLKFLMRRPLWIRGFA